MKLRKETELGLFKKNTIIFGAGPIFIRFLGFFLIPIYTRYLSVSDYGLLVTLLVTVQIMQIFMNIQMRPAFVRFYKEFDKRNLIGQLLGSSILINVLGIIVITGFAIIVLPQFFINLNGRRSFFLYLLLTSCIAASQSLCLHVISYYRARNDSVKYTFSSISVGIILFLLTFLLLAVFDFGLKGILIAQILSYGVVFIFILLRIFRTYNPSTSFKTIRNLLGFGFPLIFSGVAWFIISAADRYFLAHFKGLEVVAIYSLGYKVASILLIIVVNPFQLAYGPFTFANLGAPDIKEKLGQLFFYLVTGLTFVGLGIALFSPILVRILAPPEYSQSYLVTLCILPAMALNGIYYWAAALIHIVKKTYIIGLTMASVALLNLLLDYILIPRFGSFGAIIATNSSLLLACSTLFIIGMRNFPVNLASGFMAGINEMVNMKSKFMGVSMDIMKKIKRGFTSSI